MTTPDPDRKSAPFEWRALTINKVEKIQLARLHEEQDRIEKELREQEALEREAHALEAREREREAAEQAWFEEGAVEPPSAQEDVDTQRETAAFTPLKRLSHSVTAFARGLLNPAPKPRSSVPPPPLRESPVSISLVLAACAFGGSVYLSLRWVAEVRQANVTQQLSSQQLSSSVNATTPATNSVNVALPTRVAATPRPSQVTVAPPVTPAPTEPAEQRALSQAAPAMVLGSNTPATGIAARAVSARGQSPLQATPTANSRPTVEQPGVMLPSATVLPNVAASSTSAASSSVLPPSGASPTARARVLVPAVGSPHNSGTRVYRGGE